MGDKDDTTNYDGMTVEEDDVVILRRGTEGLSTAAYGREIQERLPDYSVRVAATPQEERAAIESARIATGITIDEALLERADRLELFVVASSGYGHLPMDALAANDVRVVNASGIHAPGIAEQVFGYILAFARRLPEGWRRQERSEWRHYQAEELAGSTVTVVGLGSVGHHVLERTAGFGVDTIGIRYTPEKGGPADEIVGFDDECVHDALARTDFLVLSSPLTETTKNFLDEAALATLPPTARVINVARGGLVDTDALTHALQIGDIAGAAIDTTDPEPLPPEHPLWNMGNVQITPHMAGHTPEHWPRLARILADSAKLLDAGRELHSMTNLVETP